MLKKIETFLAIMLAICAVLLLTAAAGRGPTEAGQETMDSSVQTTAPTTVPTTVPTTAPDTQPETEPLPQETPPAETTPADDIRAQVERILEGASLEQTAVTRLVTEPRLHGGENTVGQPARSHAHTLADVMQDRRANPVAAFWELVSAGLYDREADGTGALTAAAFQPPAQAKKQYDYTGEGARQLLTDLLTLAAGMEDGVELELALLGANLNVEADQVRYSELEKCRYAYFSCASDRATYILCCYLRGEKRIDDVELQLLYLRHASGDADELGRIDQNAKNQAASLMAAAELLMTGETKAGEGQIPFSYEVGGAKAALERFAFIGAPDRGSMINYRLNIK